MREARLQGDDGLIGALLDVNELEDIPKGVDDAQRMEALINVSNHFEPFLIKVRVFDKQVGNGRLDIVVDHFFPP
jgi:hypothetical protein